MIARMSKVEIVGERSLLQDVLSMLQDLGVFQIKSDARGDDKRKGSPALEATDQRTVFERLFLEDLKAKINQLLQALPDIPLRESYLSPRAAVGTISYTIEHHLHACRMLHAQRTALQEQRAEVGRYIGFLATLDSLSRTANTAPEVDVIGLTLKDQGALDRVRATLAKLTEGQYKFFTVPAGDGTFSGLITVDRALSDSVSRSLVTEHIPEMSFPPSFSGLTHSGKLSFLENKAERMTAEIEDIDRSAETLCRRWAPIYRGVLAWINDRLTLLKAAAVIYQTKLCFFITGWIPSRDVEQLRSRLSGLCGKKVVLEEKKIREEEMEQVPSVLRNPPYFRPFELFTRLLPLPNYTSYDPTPFLGFFFPLFFGMILGDAGYGIFLALIALFVKRRYKDRRAVRDAGRILLISSLYAVFFGIIYGEFFGDLPHRLFGIRPLLFERSESIVPLFAFALSVGVVHVLFGLALGSVAAFRKARPREGAYKLLTIVIILGMIAVAAAAAGLIPLLAARPITLTLLALLPLLLLTGGLLAPLELLKSVGNIISYIRIAAIGLTSALLAYVANQLAGLTGDVAAGIAVAALLHALNVVLGVFSPTIHALRLHFVEFFSKFIEGGGKPFQPLRKG